MGDAIQEKVGPPISVCLLDARRVLQFVPSARRRSGTSTRKGLPWPEVPRERFRRFMSAVRGNGPIRPSDDPVERVSTRVTCVGAHRRRPASIPTDASSGCPGVEWGVPAWGCSFAESLKKREGVVAADFAVVAGGLAEQGRAADLFRVQLGADEARRRREKWIIWSILRAGGLGFQKLAQERGATCYLKFPGHPSEKYADIWDFLVQQLGSDSKR